MTAELRPGRIDAISDDQLRKVAEFLAVKAADSETVTLRPNMAGKLADALLEVLNRAEAPRP